MDDKDDQMPRVWVWNSYRRELIKQRMDRPGSPSASSSTSRRQSSMASTPAGESAVQRKDEVIIRRAVEAEFGRVDPDEWLLVSDDPIDWRVCLKVAWHLTPQTTLSTLLLGILKLPLVQLLLRNLIQYFGVLFELCEEVSRIEPPAVANEELLQKKWKSKLEGALNPLSSSYMRLLTGEQLGKLHHMKQGRSLHSNKVRDEKIWEGFYEVAELLVWLVFRRRDIELIRREFARLFRGPLGEGIQPSEELAESISELEEEEELGFTKLNTKAMKIEMKKRKRHISYNFCSSSGLMSRRVPHLQTARLVTDSYERMPTLVYVPNKDGSFVWCHGVGLLGARKGGFNELLEPSEPEEDEIESLLDD